MVTISRGNSKMGSIASVSLPPVETCPACGCREICYAKKLCRIRPSVRDSYKRNLTILRERPDEYWEDVEDAVRTSRFFRFHVSGDIVDAAYLRNIVEIAGRNPSCEILCFTKRYGLVNDLIGGGTALPKNLHLIFSKWRDYPMENPYGLPEAHVRYRDGFTTAAPYAIRCGGNCTNCAKTGSGCWTLGPGRQIVFDQH